MVGRTKRKLNRKKLREIGIIRGSVWRMMRRKTTESAIRAVMLEGEITNYVDRLQGVAHGCTLSPTKCEILHQRPYLVVNRNERVLLVNKYRKILGFSCTT